MSAMTDQINFKVARTFFLPTLPKRMLNDTRHSKSIRLYNLVIAHNKLNFSENGYE